jgi:hypothetical protein
VELAFSLAWLAIVSSADDSAAIVRRIGAGDPSVALVSSPPLRYQAVKRANCPNHDLLWLQRDAEPSFYRSADNFTESAKIF